MEAVEEIKRSISEKRYNITLHAREEMSPKEDDISERELIEAINMWIDYRYRRGV